MQPQRETMTDSLADIIQIIHLGGKDGTLTVERSAGEKAGQMLVEEGYIVFVNGRVVEAAAGPYSGLAAFNYLNTWKRCRFSFVSSGSGTLPTVPSSRQGNNDEATHAFGTTAFPRNKAIPSIRREAETGINDTRSASASTNPVRLPAGGVTLQRPEAMQLPRSHRRLLLLVNGQRSVGELARLMARSIEEVRAMLAELENAGLIRQ